MGILGGGWWRGLKLGAGCIKIVIAGVERHRTRAFHRGDGLHLRKLIGRIFMRNGDRAVAAGRKGQTGSGIEPIGATPFPIGTVPTTLPFL